MAVPERHEDPVYDGRCTVRKIIITWEDKIVVSRQDDKGEYDASMYDPEDFGSWLFLLSIWSWIMPK